MIKFGRYNLCFFDLITDKKDGKLDGSKIWQHISNGIICYSVMNAKEITWELITALGAVVGGSYVGVQWLKNKYQQKGGDNVQSN